MMYPFLTLKDESEITHSDMDEQGNVKVYIEKPDEKDGFHYVTFFLPSFRRENVYKFSETELAHYEEILRYCEKCILQFAQEGGFDSTENLSDG